MWWLNVGNTRQAPDAGPVTADVTADRLPRHGYQVADPYLRFWPAFPDPNATVTLTLYDAEHPEGLPLRPTATTVNGNGNAWTVSGTYPVHGTDVAIQVQLTDPQDGVVPVTETFAPAESIVPDVAATEVFTETGTRVRGGRAGRGGGGR